MNCDSCKEKQYTVKSVPFNVYEITLSRFERTIKRLWIVVIILIGILLATNLGWIYYESQWQVVETTEVEQEVDSGDGPAYVVGIGDLNYGESKTDDQNY